MTENDQAWKRNTPENRAKRRAAWESWGGGQRESDQPPGRRPEGYQRHRWT